MRELEVGEYILQVDLSERMITAVWEDGEEILDTLPDSKVFDLMSLAEQEARDQHEEDRDVSDWQDYNGC
jgi:hypothetical protein